MEESEVKRLVEEESLAHLRAEICLFSPESYSLEEKGQIAEDIDRTGSEIEEAMREDFRRMSPEGQAAMLSLLEASGCMSREWWEEVLK